MANQNIILRVGCEGGDITLYGEEQGQKWVFFCQSIDQSLQMIGEGTEKNQRSSEFFTLAEALKALDRYEWYKLLPLSIHPIFSDAILGEIYERRERAVLSELTISEWHRIAKLDQANYTDRFKAEVPNMIPDQNVTSFKSNDPVSLQPKLDIVYVLTNPVMPGLIKIGYTTQKDAKVRIDQLYTTGVPVPFDIAYACKVGNAIEVEHALHTAFGPSRINPKREFFRIDPEQAIAILKLLHTEEATDEVESQPSIVDRDSVLASQQVKAKRPNMDFSEMSIPENSILRSVKGDFMCIVSGPKKVTFEGEEMSLTAATRLMYGLDYSIQPSPHWTWNRKTLKEIYDETYNSSE